MRLSPWVREFAQKNIIKLGPCHLDTSLRLSPLLRKFVQKNVIKIGPCHLEWGKKMVSPSARDPGNLTLPLTCFLYLLTYFLGKYWTISLEYTFVSCFQFWWKCCCLDPAGSFSRIVHFFPISSYRISRTAWHVPGPNLPFPWKIGRFLGLISM